MQNKYIVSISVVGAIAVLLGVVLLNPRKGNVVSTNSGVIVDTNGSTSVNKNMIVKVFFGNTKNNSEMMDCSLVYPTDRVVSSTTAVGTAAIHQLLAGTTSQEEAVGYFTSINKGVKLNSLQIKDSVAYADFDENLEWGVGGSCRISTIISQIRATLKQFPTVNDVVISIDGKTEPILQP